MVFSKGMFRAAFQTASICALLAVVAIILAQAGSCPMTAKCPLDGAQAMLVTTEYEGIVAIGVYEHTTTTGETHRFRMRCN